MRNLDGIMRFMILFALAASAGILSGCNRESWPLSAGNQWTYLIRAKEGRDSGEWVVTVKSVKKEGRTKKALIDITGGKNDNFKPIRTMLVSTPQGYYYQTPDDTGQATEPVIVRREFEVSADNPPFIFKNKPSVGQEWNFTSKLVEPEFKREKDVRGTGKIESEETVNVLAGNYSTFRVQWIVMDTSGNLVRNETLWFKKGIGPVKMEISNTSQPMVLNLKKALIGGKKIGEW